MERVEQERWQSGVPGAPKDPQNYRVYIGVYIGSIKCILGLCREYKVYIGVI